MTDPKCLYSNSLIPTWVSFQGSLDLAATPKITPLNFQHAQLSKLGGVEEFKTSLKKAHAAQDLKPKIV